MSEPLIRRVALPDTAATERLGAALGAALPQPFAGWLLLLDGELGAGKSTLARALLRARGHEGPVPSPTYTLVEPYDFPEGTIYHVDLYRINAPDELEYLGFDELRAGLVLVEWPERVPALAAQADVRIALAYDGAARRACLEAVSARAAAWLAGVSLGGSDSA